MTHTKDEVLNIAGQCRATASSPLAKTIAVDGGNGLLCELLLDAAKAIEAFAAQPAPVAIPVAQPLDALENKYLADGQEYVFESASYYARSRQLARAEQAIVKARIRLNGDCKQSLDKRTMPDWELVNQLAAESLSYITQYLKIETYGKSTTKDDLKAMAEVNFQPPAAQPAVPMTDEQISKIAE